MNWGTIAGVLLCSVLLAGCARPATTTPSPAGASATATSAPVGSKPLRPDAPTHIGSARLGQTGSDVVSVFGRGLFDPNDSEGDGHYYVRSDRSATLHVRVGTDDAVVIVELTRGVEVPRRLTLTVASHSKTFDSVRPTWDDLPLGASYAQVVDTFGLPDSELRSGATRMLEYDVSIGPPVTVTVTLAADQVQRIGYYCPN